MGITAFLIWFSLRNLTLSGGEGTFSEKWEYLVQTWNNAEKNWLFAMAALAVVSFIIRSERWRMLIQPSGHKPSLASSFLSLMVGYLVNLVIPRGGEISRCYNLYKLSNTPVEVSFGTVVIERIVDLICLVALLFIAFILESEKLLGFVESLPIGTGNTRQSVLLYLCLFIIFFTALFFWLFKTNKKVKAFVVKTWSGFKTGLLSIFKLERKGLFILYSLSIWVLYFLMSYTVIMAFPQTSHLGISGVLSLFAIGTIAMAAPLPGGTGSYHVLVPQGLVFLYGVPSADAVAFTFIFHGWQTAIMIVGGAISLIVTSFVIRNKTSLLKNN
nr:lysylphosphatidylglycerol synthase transmembrane domain-containing protein [Chryseosolibacter indicus]